jgi:hypothetical protein
MTGWEEPSRFGRKVETMTSIRGFRSPLFFRKLSGEQSQGIIEESIRGTHRRSGGCALAGDPDQQVTPDKQTWHRYVDSNCHFAVSASGVSSALTAVCA